MSAKVCTDLPGRKRAHQCAKRAGGGGEARGAAALVRGWLPPPPWVTGGRHRERRRRGAEGQAPEICTLGRSPGTTGGHTAHPDRRSPLHRAGGGGPGWSHQNPNPLLWDTSQGQPEAQGGLWASEGNAANTLWASGILLSSSLSPHPCPAEAPAAHPQAQGAEAAHSANLRTAERTGVTAGAAPEQQALSASSRAAPSAANLAEKIPGPGFREAVWD